LKALRLFAALHRGEARPTWLFASDPALYMAARRAYGTVRAALRAARVRAPDARSTAPRWTRVRLVREIRNRHRSGQAMTARHQSALVDAARAVFGGWRQALQAAGVPAVPRGRPPEQTPRVAPPPPVSPGASPPPQLPLHLPPLDCKACGRTPHDLGMHVVEAHLLTPRRYKALYGPLPDRADLFVQLVGGLRDYLAQGGKPQEAALERRAPELHAALRLLRFFPDLPSAFAYVQAGAGGQP
jgi:hypothetical protein